MTALYCACLYLLSLLEALNLLLTREEFEKL